MKTRINKWLLALIAILLVAVAVLLAVLLQQGTDGGNAGAADTTPATTLAQESVYEEEVPETTGIPLNTKYVELSYPTELEDTVRIQYEDLSDGQQIIFITEFTGEELELFRFSISKSGTDGHQLGTLSDEAAGTLLVCVQVQEYTDGSWDPEDYAKLNEMQSRVNDIIIQFYEDPRFVPANS